MFFFLQEYIRNNETKLRKNLRLEKVILPHKRKFSELEAEDLNIESEKKVEEFTEMYCPFVRGHYAEPNDVPKVRLLRWFGTEFGDKNERPKYFTWQKDKMFRSIVMINDQAFSSQSWEKNKKYSEQAAAIVALHCLGVRKIQMDKGASNASGIVYAEK